MVILLIVAVLLIVAAFVISYRDVLPAQENTAEIGVDVYTIDEIGDLEG